MSNHPTNPSGQAGPTHELPGIGNPSSHQYIKKQDPYIRNKYTGRPIVEDRDERNEETVYPPTQHIQTPDEDTLVQPKPSKWQIWWPRIRVTLACFLPVVLETLDYTVVATAQTTIASYFNRLDLQSYVGTSYVLGSTVFLPIFASLADVFGRYWAMQSSIIIFLIGSALSTGATSMAIVLLGRGIAGVGAAGLLTVIRILLSDSQSLDDNNILGALMVVVYSTGFSIGPSVGGAILKTSWRWVFGINLPVCAVSVVIFFLLLRTTSKGPQPPQHLNRLNIPEFTKTEFLSKYPPGLKTSLQRIDTVGALIFIVSGIAILLGLNWGSTDSGGWNQPKVIISLVIGVILIPVFVLWEYVVDHSTDYLVDSGLRPMIQQISRPTKLEGMGFRARLTRLAPSFVEITDPMLPMNMFRSIDVIACNFATLTSGMVMLGIFYFVSIFFIIVGGKDATKAGIQCLYFAPGIGIGAVISIVMVKVLRQPKPTILLGLVVTPLAIGLLGQAMYENNAKHIMGFMIMSGAGIGIAFGPLTYQIRFTQPEDRVAIAVASNLFFRTAGGVIGLAQLSAVMFSQVRTYITKQIISGRITPSDAVRISASLASVGTVHGGGTSSTTGSGGIFGLPDNLRAVTTEAFKDGIRWAFLSLLPWLGISLLVCLFLTRVDPERLNVKSGQVDITETNREKRQRRGDIEVAPVQ
ncbi:MFS general substrate transporter [Serendipita vermifera]|nr:MFS general substrate transporter [Serendipita vermifera]